MTRAANWRRWVTLGVAVVPLAASASLDARRHQSATPAAAAKAPTLTSITPRQRGHWGRYRVDREGRGIDVYAAHDSQPKPLVIFIHGSGCAPLVTVDTDGTFRDTTLFQDVVAQRLATAHFAMIDKRGVEPLRFSARWKTFWLDSTPIDDVRESTVPLFLAQGSREGTTLAADLFALEAVRPQPSRPIRYVVVEQGDHAFETRDRKSHVLDLFDDFLQWTLNPARQTSLGTLK